MKKIIIDCDPGMDDSMAIILALKSEKLKTLGITTVAGNYPIEITTKNALKITELLGKTDIGVYEGMSSPLVRKSPSDPFTHGKDGQAENNLKNPQVKEKEIHAVDFIINQVIENKNEVSLVCCGPLTNIAMAIKKKPEIVGYIKEIIAISGAFGINEYAYINATGDTPQSEWNVYVDPEAADIVYNSGANFTALGLDIVTHFEVDFSSDNLSLLEKSPLPEANFLKTSINFVRKRGYGAYCAVIDCLAVAYAIDKNLVETITGKVGIEKEGFYSYGATILERRAHHGWDNMAEIRIGKSVDYERFLKMILDLVLKER